MKFLVGFTNKGTEDFIVESLDASFRYPQDYQFYIQNFTALPLNTIVPPQRQATFEYSFIPAEPMGGRPFGLVINLNYKDLNVRPFELCFVFVRDCRGQWPLSNAFLSDKCLYKKDCLSDSNCVYKVVREMARNTQQHSMNVPA